MQPNLYNATDYANWQLLLASPVTASAMQAQLNLGYVTIKGRKVNPLAASCVVSVDNLSTNQENVTLTSVTNPQAQSGFPPTFISATFGKAHGLKAIVASSTFGLQEAVNDALNQGGGLVIIDNTWPGPAGSSVILALPVGSSTVGIQDIRGGGSLLYAWGGSAYALSGPGVSAVWGAITGTLSAQTDLNTALGLKAPLASPTFTGHPVSPDVTLTAAAPTVAAARVGLGATTQATVGAAGGASALPATPTGYLIINVAGTAMVIPYFAAS